LTALVEFFFFWGGEKLFQSGLKQLGDWANNLDSTWFL